MPSTDQVIAYAVRLFAAGAAYLAANPKKGAGIAFALGTALGVWFF